MNILKDTDGSLRSTTNLELLGHWFEVDSVIYYILFEPFKS